MTFTSTDLTVFLYQESENNTISFTVNGSPNGSDLSKDSILALLAQSPLLTVVSESTTEVLILSLLVSDLPFRQKFIGNLFYSITTAYLEINLVITGDSKL